MIRYLALGDSYTIGEKVAPNERWPVQLVATLQEHGYIVDDPVIIAQTGWTTDELLQALEHQTLSDPFDIVTLLIGVNDQYRGQAPESYRAAFIDVLTQAIGYAGGNAAHNLVLSIPDWGVTPFAMGQNRQQIAQEIAQFNTINREETSRLGARYIDITSISRTAAENTTLLASDGLHPSAQMYALWVDFMLPSIQAAILEQ
jgi:lysophospholipase L1-like esterase